MGYEVEVHRSVDWFVRKRCTAAEQAAFYEKLEVLRTEPIGNSEPIFDPQIKPHMLRFFRFGANKALFEYDPGRNRIRVLACRKRSRKRRPGNRVGLGEGEA